MAWRADLGALGLLWLLVALYHARLFLPRPLRTYVVAGDFSNQFFPYRHFAASEWWQGRLPLWNPYVFAGHPFFADVQTAVFYPVTWITALVSRGDLRYVVLEGEMALHYALAATFCYLLGRVLFGSRLAATVTALVFTFSGFLTSYPAQQLAMLETAVWLPLAISCVEIGVRRRDRAIAWAGLAGGSLGLALLAGHPQTALLAGYLVAAYLVYRYRTIGWCHPLAGLIVCGGAAIGLAGVSLLPAYEFLALSNRTEMDYLTAGVGYEISSLLGILFPLWRGEKALSVGVVALLLAAVAIRWDWRGPVRFWTGVWLFGVILSVGARLPLFWVLYHFVPGFDLFRDQERAMYVAALAGAVLAGQGCRVIEAHLGSAGSASSKATILARWLRRHARHATLAGVPIAAIVAIRWVAIGAPPTGSTQALLFATAPTITVLGLVFALVVMSIRPERWDGAKSPSHHQGDDHWGAPPPPHPRHGDREEALPSPRPERKRASAPIWQIGLVALVVLDLWLVNYGNNQSPENPNPRPRFDATAQAIHADAAEPFRIRPANDEVFPPNYAGPLALPTINGDTPFMLARHADLLYRADADYRLWQLLNVKYVLLPPDRPPVDGLEPLLARPDHVVYRMIYSLPRAWAVQSARIAATPEEARAAVLAPDFHPGDVVVLEEVPDGGPIRPGPRPDVTITAISPRRVEIATSAAAPAYLVLADTYYPGWTARVDGEVVPIYRANYLTRAILLPEGAHQVVFSFEPWSLRVGGALSLATLLAIVVAGLRAGGTRRADVGTVVTPEYAVTLLPRPVTVIARRLSAAVRWSGLPTALAMGATVAAFGVRVVALGDPNLVNDEWWMLRTVREGLWWIVGILRTFEPHPPLYYLAIQGWAALTGESEFALRFLGAGTSVLVVPAAWLVGRAMRQPWLGVVSAWLVALNPFLVAYAQFTRVYAPITAFGLLATAALLLAIRADTTTDTPKGIRRSADGPASGASAAIRRQTAEARSVRRPGTRTVGIAGPWRRYLVCALLAVLTQYTAWAAFGGHLVLLAVLVWRRQVAAEARRQWIVASGVVAAVAAAWLVYAVPGLLVYRGYYPDHVGLVEGTERLVAAFAAGTYAFEARLALANGAVALALLGLVWLGRRDRLGTTTIAFAALFPLAPSLYLMTTRPLFDERYVIVVVPAYLILAAAGCLALDRLLRVPVATLGMLAMTTAALLAYYPAVTAARPDYRSAARYIDALARPGDVVVVTRQGAGELFAYYDRRDLPLILVEDDPSRVLAEIPDQPDSNVWFVPAGEDHAFDDAVARHLLDRAHVVDDRWFNTARVIWFAQSPNDDGWQRHAGDVQWGEALRLQEYAVDAAPREPGDPLRVLLRWETERAPTVDYKLSYRLLDAAGRIAAAVDRPPLHGLVPTSSWEAGVEVVDRHGLAIPPLLPGTYTLELVVYDATSGTPAELVVDGKPTPRFTIASVVVARASRPEAARVLPAAEPARTTTNHGRIALHDVRLMTASVAPGDPARLTLWWQATDDPEAPAPETIAFAFERQDGTTPIEVSQPIAESLPPGEWQPGEGFLIQYDVPVPVTAEGGTYRLLARAQGPNGQLGDAIAVGTVTIQASERSFTPPNPTHPVRYRLGDAVELVGLDLSADRVQPGETVSLTLYWHALGTPEKSYTVFTHLVDASGTIRGQHDQPPLGGRRPTSGWREGEYLADHYQITIAADVAEGPLRLVVGMYDPNTGERLPTFDANGTPLGDAIPLGEVEQQR